LRDQVCPAGRVAAPPIEGAFINSAIPDKADRVPIQYRGNSTADIQDDRWSTGDSSSLADVGLERLSIDVTPGNRRIPESFDYERNLLGAWIIVTRLRRRSCSKGVHGITRVDHDRCVGHCGFGEQPAEFTV
jgi:hypothetical protein